MFEYLAITNRLLCPHGAFLGQIEKIVASGIKAVVLREKDLSIKEYLDLARDVLGICAAKNVRFIVHGLPKAALELECSYLHLPWTVFKENCLSSNSPAFLSLWKGKKAPVFGVSVHSTEEAALAIERGASWLIGGHIFATQSKEGLENRGPEFLADLCKLSPVPVYGIGGINERNIAAISKTGAEGACLMSSLMQSPDPCALIKKLRVSLNQTER
jgi:thiamine-phosphate pyrophosphorylase